MSTVRNTLVSFGVFWLSRWIAVASAWPLSKFTDRIIYGESLLSALAMGIMNSMGRTLAAALAGALVTTAVASRKSELWALIVAVLYLADAPVRHHWNYPATSWDLVWQTTDLLLPAVACVAAAILTARLRRNRGHSQRAAGSDVG